MVAGDGFPVSTGTTIPLHGNDGRGWVPVCTGTTVGCTGTTVWEPGMGSRFHGNDGWLHGNDGREPGSGNDGLVAGDGFPLSRERRLGSGNDGLGVR